MPTCSSTPRRVPLRLGMPTGIAIMVEQFAGRHAAEFLNADADRNTHEMLRSLAPVALTSHVAHDL
jgi:hypothetical protein